MKEELIALIEGCAREVGEQNEVAVPEQLGAATALLGEQGVFDSLGLVNLVVAVEQAIEDRYQTIVCLADARAMSQKRSPFRTIESLAEYAQTLIQEKN